MYLKPAFTESTKGLAGIARGASKAVPRRVPGFGMLAFRFAPGSLHCSAAHTYPNTHLGTALPDQWWRSTRKTNPGDAKPRAAWPVGA
jgi:hypothetical protein